jgi:Holliday junction resolvasome RuvABC DNA-binding subunit
VLELKEKLVLVDTGVPESGDLTARDALVELGWALIDAERALASVDPELPVEEQVRHVLRQAA